MSSRPGSRRRLPIVVASSLAAILVCVLIAVLVLSGGDLPYAVRALVHQDSYTSDVDWKHSVTVPARDPRPFPQRDACDVTETALEDSGLGTIDDWMTRSGRSAFVSIEDGVLTCERYADGVEPSTRLPVFSVSKTITSLLLARAVDDGAITSIDDPITDYVPELIDRDPRFASITLADLVDLRSGIGFDLVADFPFLDQDASRIYYASSIRRTVLEDARIESPPGPFTYNDFAPNLVGLAIERARGADVSEIGTPELWRVLGAEDEAAWLVDDEEFPWHESGFVASARDLAKVGQVLLDHDISGDVTVAPADFLDRTGSPLGDDSVDSPVAEGMGYSNGWWVGDGGRSFAAVGRYGQLILVAPESRLVLVRLGRSGFEAQQSNTDLLDQLMMVADARAARTSGGRRRRASRRSPCRH